MGFDWAKKCNHINFGMITGMSTRKGTWPTSPNRTLAARDSRPFFFNTLLQERPSSFRTFSRLPRSRCSTG
jgi:arginyl-tRNA synthetase